MPCGLAPIWSNDYGAEVEMGTAWALTARWFLFWPLPTEVIGRGVVIVPGGAMTNQPITGKAAGCQGCSSLNAAANPTGLHVSASPLGHEDSPRSHPPCPVLPCHFWIAS